MPFAIYALALAAFAIGSAEFVISGILPPLAQSLAVSIPTAGLLVSAYAAGVAVGGPIIAVATARFSQRSVLVGVMLTFGVAQVLCALAPDYNMLLLARLLSACAHGVFFGAGNIVVVGLVPPERRGAAFSMFISGITLANLLGLPGGTAIGVAFGWRTSFLAVGALGFLAAIVLFFRIPHAQATDGPRPSFRTQLAELKHQQVWLSYLTIAFVMVGSLAFGTFQVPILTEITGLPLDLVSVYLLIGGLGSVAGIFLGGRGTDWKPMPTLITVLLLQALFYFTMLFAMHDKLAMTVNLLATSVVSYAFSTPLQARILAAAHKAPNLASSLISAAFNVGIAIGAFIGATALTAGMSYAQIPIIGIIASLAAATTATLSFMLERRAKRYAAG